MKLYVVFLATLLLAACAGTPPAWWNPSGVYPSAKTPSASQVGGGRVGTGATALAEEEPLPQEQNIDPLTEHYEELSLTPLEVSEPPTVPADPNVQNPSAQILPETADNPLPSDDFLPPPSVLE